jgi:hypothetical protein
MPKRVCSEPGCGHLIDAGRTRCTEHESAHNIKRGSSTQRGYDYRHQQERKAWVRPVRTGSVACRRCKQPIIPGTPWDLGHPDADCPDPTAPEHEGCNRATAGR